MPRFFCDAISGDTACIEGDDARHIARVLRLREGDALTLCDLKGTDYDCRIREVDPHRVVLGVESSMPSQTESSVSIRLYQALPKGDKFEFIIQKAVELGVDAIIPVMTHRCVSRPDAKTLEKKLQRWQRVAFEAAKQSMRGKIPQVEPLMDFDEAVEDMLRCDRAILFYERATRPLPELLEGEPATIAVMVGSEGGFEEDEVERALAAGAASVTLGKRILRCETAPITALSVIQYATGNLM